MTLHLTQHPDSSSLLPVNAALFADFWRARGNRGTSTIEVDTLDHLLTGKPQLSPDFIKVDVEGGELEVLKGAAAALSTTVMGLKVENFICGAACWAPAALGD